MKDKLTTIIGIGIAACVIFTFLFCLIAKDDIELFDIFTILIIAILVITSLYLIWDRVKNLKAGLPAQDKRLKDAGYKAGYYGFIAAIWSAVGSNLGNNLIFD
jgi:4-hydroxybenzoate polyprenyltransferase